MGLGYENYVRGLTELDSINIFNYLITHNDNEKYNLRALIHNDSMHSIQGVEFNLEVFDEDTNENRQILVHFNFDHTLEPGGQVVANELINFRLKRNQKPASSIRVGSVAARTIYGLSENGLDNIVFTGSVSKLQAMQQNLNALEETYRLNYNTEPVELTRNITY